MDCTVLSPTIGDDRRGYFARSANSGKAKLRSPRNDVVYAHNSGSFMTFDWDSLDEAYKRWLKDDMTSEDYNNLGPVDRRTLRTQFQQQQQQQMVSVFCFACVKATITLSRRAVERNTVV